MFQLSYNDKTFKVGFKYGKDPITSNKLTEAVIYEKIGNDKDKIIWGSLTMGSAICSEHDNFCRNIGRKIALSRALSHIPNREMRRAFWGAYFYNRGKF